MTHDKSLIIIWGGYPPIQGGASVRISRIVNYISDLVKINLITKKAKNSSIFEKSETMSLFRIPPSDIKTDKSNNFIYYIQVFFNSVFQIIRILYLYPTLYIIGKKSKPIAIVKEATTWELAFLEHIIKTKYLFVLLKPWILISRWFKIPLYIYFTNLWSHRKYISYLNTKLHYADCIIVVDTWMKDFLENEMNVKKPIYYVPVCIDTKIFLKNNFHFPAQNKILFVARLSQDRGCDILIKSIPIIISKIPDVNVEIVGDGNLMKNLVNLAQDLNVSTFINFKGNVDPINVSNVYEGAKVFVNSLRVPGIGNVTIESMASGVPVIKSKIGNTNNEPIEEGINGYLFEMDDYQDLAQKILKILRMNEVEWIEMSKNCRDTAEKYSIPEVCSKLLKCFSLEV